MNTTAVFLFILVALTSINPYGVRKTKMTKKQAEKQLREAQREMIEAMRRGDQRAVDQASDKATSAFAEIANAKKNR